MVAWRPPILGAIHCWAEMGTPPHMHCMQDSLCESKEIYFYKCMYALTAMPLSSYNIMEM